MKANLILIMTLVSFQGIAAQEGLSDIRKGNRQYKNEKFDQAELSYRKAAEGKSSAPVAEFNLGTALYRQKKFEDAAKQFESYASTENQKESSAKGYHNYGNSLLEAGKIEESINAYKESLRRNPGDLSTKYNLSYAMMLKKKQEQKQQNQNQDQNSDQKENEKKDNQQQDQQNKQDQQNQQSKEQQSEDNKSDQVPSSNQNARISKEDAERLLEALANDEKKVQEKVKKEKAKAAKVRTLKDW